MAWWIKRIGIGAAGLLLVAAFVLAVVLPRVLDRVYYRGPASDHFDGAHFFNPEGEQGTGGAQHFTYTRMTRFLAGTDRVAWPASVPVTPTRPPARVDGQAMRVTWIGHSTVLVQTQGLNILTDPVWAERASPVSFIGPKRVREPGVRLGDLPHVDLVLVSHNHYDHLDLATLKTLWQRDRPLIVTGLGNDALLAGHGIGAVARDWGQRVAVRPGIDVIIERVHHWTSRWGYDRDRALWCGFTVTLPGGNIVFTGDTGPGDMRWPARIAADGPFRLAILPIGAFKPRELMSGNHISPAEAVTAFQMLHARAALGVHWGTFQLTEEGIDEPREELAATLKARGIAPERFRATEAGVAWMVPPLGG